MKNFVFLVFHFLILPSPLNAAPKSRNVVVNRSIKAKLTTLDEDTRSIQIKTTQSNHVFSGLIKRGILEGPGKIEYCKGSKCRSVATFQYWDGLLTDTLKIKNFGGIATASISFDQGILNGPYQFKTKKGEVHKLSFKNGEVVSESASKGGRWTDLGHPTDVMKIFHSFFPTYLAEKKKMGLRSTQSKDISGNLMGFARSQKNLSGEWHYYFGLLKKHSPLEKDGIVTYYEDGKASIQYKTTNGINTSKRPVTSPPSAWEEVSSFHTSRNWAPIGVIGVGGGYPQNFNGDLTFLLSPGGIRDGVGGGIGLRLGTNSQKIHSAEIGMGATVWYLLGYAGIGVRTDQEKTAAQLTLEVGFLSPTIYLKGSLPANVVGPPWEAGVSIKFPIF